jgi:predicted short-subunit dehydrogenase-like oxidoreductase (DUF2520 family)
MAEGKKPRPKIAIVGAGKLGSALALSLRAAGYTVSEIVSRDRDSSRRRGRQLARRVGSRAVVVSTSEIAAQIVWLCVPDREIARCVRSLAGINWKGKIAFHSSGALGSESLAALRRRGAKIASVHPMMTFVGGVSPSLRGVLFAMEGDREALSAARRIVHALGGESFLIAKKDKSLYHAWGTFASPLLTALLATAEAVANEAGVPARKARRWMAPIVRQTVENYTRRGGVQGVSGPILRGDTETVQRHLKVLRVLPEARAAYRALAYAALKVLPARNRRELKALLG